ncbi:hypothetical protein [Salinispora mooreana]|uniref:hypothetical protein n=1 Tax=Salinispora mooreana TaxID=999545 RepID=UPI00039EAC46|nr:hypothetical protein [Salinispora mooreana]
MIDAHKRPSNPLERADTTGQSTVLFWVGLLPLAPALALVYLGTRSDQPWLTWAGAPVGVLTGVVVAWVLGGLAIRKLTEDDSDLLHTMRTGRPTVARNTGTSTSSPGSWRCTYDPCSDCRSPWSASSPASSCTPGPS